MRGLPLAGLHTGMDGACGVGAWRLISATSPVTGETSVSCFPLLDSTMAKGRPGKDK